MRTTILFGLLLIGTPAVAGGGWHNGSIEDFVAEVFEDLDTDGNTTLSAAEVEGHWIAYKFERADADENGEMSQEELIAFKRAMMAGHTVKTEAKGSVETFVDTLIADLDTNADNTLSIAEIGDHWLATKFDSVDADADRKLSHAEVTAFKTHKPTH